MNPGPSTLCPSCAVTLTRRRVGAASILECTTCHGAAINLAVVRQIVAERDVSTLWQHVRASRVAGSRACPTCGKLLRPFSIMLGGSEMKLDGCLVCHALWFDGTELEQMRAASRPETRKRVSGRNRTVEPAEHNSDGWDGFEALLDVADLFCDSDW